MRSEVGGTIDRMIERAILTSLRGRLERMLAAPARRFRPLRVDSVALGYVDDARAERLAAFTSVFRVSSAGVEFVPRLGNARSRNDAMVSVCETLAKEGALSAWRDERYAVADNFGASPVFELERAAARYFGIPTFAAHINGVTERGGRVAMWFARRSPSKPIDPGMLDNLVGGGIRSGTTITETIRREAWEEAGIAFALARFAVHVSTVTLRRDLPDGLQRETVFVHDLSLPTSFAPVNRDGEVVAHRLVDLAEACRLLSLCEGDDEVTADATLVALDYLLRSGAIPRAEPDHARLTALCHMPL
jgi:8-oxo-dGTP pyrophosphatase MutT (NUDIX family)